MCLLAAYFLTAYVKSRRRFAAAVPVDTPYVARWLASNPLRRRVRVSQTNLPYGPLAYGLLRPVILLPKRALRLPEEQLSYILAHELTHVRRFDALKKLCLTMALCIHWFNPLVWAMFTLANRDLEIACDGQVTRALGKDGRPAYALTLLDMEAGYGGVPSLMNGFGKYAIEERIVAIMKMKRQPLPGIILSIALVLVLGLCLGTTGLAGEQTPEATRSGTGAVIERFSVDIADEFRTWLAEKSETLRALIGSEKASGDGAWTQEDVEAIIAVYEGLLRELELYNAHVQVSSPEEDGMAMYWVRYDGNAYIPSHMNQSITLARTYSTSLVIGEAQTVAFGPHATQETLEAEVRAYLNLLVEALTITNEDAQRIMTELRE